MKKLCMFLAAFLAVLVVAQAVSAAQFVPSGNYGIGKCCVGYYDYNWENAGDDHVIGQLTERINAMELAIIEAMRLSTGQLSGNSKEQIGAQSNLANTEDDRAVVARVEDARLKAITDSASSPNGCNVISAASGVNGLDTGSQDYQQKLTEDLGNWASGANNMPQSTEEAIQKRVELTCSTYANDQDVRSGLCQNVGSFPNADVNADQSIYYHAPGTTSATLDEDRVKAAKAFLLNTINPQPAAALLPDQAKTPGGAQLAAANKTDAGRMSIANDAAAEILSHRTAQASGDYANILQATASQITGYKGKFDQGLSWYDYMDIRAKSWHMDPNFASNIESGNPGQAEKATTEITAFNAYVGWETYKLLEKQNLILATMLAMQTEQARRNGIVSAPTQ